MIRNRGINITLGIIGINVILFLLMVVYGVDILQPQGEDIIRWGSNYKPYTLDTQWWRLVTSCFLHIGILHLFMNMYALFFIGLQLEPILGWWRFALAYILTGIAGSTASLWWHDTVNSAGASGAVFGMLGIFLVFLLTDLMNRKIKRTVFFAFVVFLGYSLIYGMQDGIDNAAHIGGLIAGVVIALVYYFSIKKEKQYTSLMWTIPLVSLLILIPCYSYLIMANKDIVLFDKNMVRFEEYQEVAITYYEMANDKTKQKKLEIINERILPNWQNSLEMLNSNDNFQIGETLLSRNEVIKDYVHKRIEYFNKYKEDLESGGAIDHDTLNKINAEINSILEELND